METLFSRQFIVWAIVGVTTIGLDFVIFLFTHLITHSIPISNFVSIVLSSVFNFFMHRLRTFRNPSNFKNQANKYSFYQFIIWILGTQLIILFIHLGASIEIAKLLPLLVIAPINYFALKNWVYG